jgi:hypothetical protein
VGKRVEKDIARRRLPTPRRLDEGLGMLAQRTRETNVGFSSEALRYFDYGLRIALDRPGSGAADKP